MACPCLTDFKAVSNNTAKCVCSRVLSQLKETNTYEQVYNTTLTCLGHWTQVIIPRPLRCISRLRLHSLVPLQGPLHYYGLQSFLCSKTVILSSLSSDSTPLKHLNAQSFQIYIFCSDPSSELQMHTWNYLLNTSNWRPNQLLKLKSELPCHLPPTSQQRCPFLLFRYKTWKSFWTPAFLVSLIQGFINPVGFIFKIHPTPITNHHFP